MLSPLLYVLALAGANVITASTVPLNAGPLLITWGTWTIAATFVLRDLVQLEHGRSGAYLTIAAGLAVSAIASVLLGDPLAITVGSAISLAVSESADTEVFTRLRARLPARVLTSGLVGGTLDSVVFALVGLSPLWANIVPWSALGAVIAGQIIVKSAMQIVGAAVVARIPELEPAHAT